MSKKIKFDELWSIEIFSNKKIADCIGTHEIMFTILKHPTLKENNKFTVTKFSIKDGDNKQNFREVYRLVERSMWSYFKKKVDLSKEKFSVKIKETDGIIYVYLLGREGYECAVFIDEKYKPSDDYGFEKEETRKPFGFKVLDWLFGLGGALDVIKLKDIPSLKFGKLKGGKNLRNFNSYRTQISYAEMISHKKDSKLISFRLEGITNLNNESLRTLISEFNKELIKRFPDSKPLEMEFAVSRLKKRERIIQFEIRAIDYPVKIFFTINTVYTPIPVRPNFRP